MKLNEKNIHLIRTAIRKAVKPFVGDEDTTPDVLTDFYILPASDTGLFSVYDDDDHLLAQTATQQDWANSNVDDFDAEIGRELSALLHDMRKEGEFDNLHKLIMPFSFVQVNENHEQVSELLIVDDDETLLISQDLLQGLDKDLDDFLDQLLKED